jgi:carbamoyltransferase
MEQSSLGLGIHDGHNSSACLLKDGKVVAALSEERLSREKNDCGFPEKSVDHLLRVAKAAPKDLAFVALGTRMMHHKEFFQNWDWYRKGYSDQVREAEEEPPRRKNFVEERLRERKSRITQLGVPEDRIHVIEHHEGHAAAAYYASPWVGDGKDVLVLTLDGSGDGVCATVNVAREGRLQRIAETKSGASIGKIYSRVTFLLGMKPWEHEYKVMGLAPYADAQGAERAYAVLKELVQLEEGSLVFKLGSPVSTNYCYSFLKERLENYRFDWIAGGIQRLVEEMVTAWVRHAVGKTGVRRVACGGGVFMNVKANMLISQMEDVAEMFVFPSCGDESLCFGAAYQVEAMRQAATGKPLRIRGLETAYVGPGYTTAEIHQAVYRFAGPKGYRVSEVTAAAVARLLAEGEIVARFAGEMEWGARALGNRSILMDPRRTENVQKLNSAIKRRDFWMPFAPTVLAERAGDYLVNPKAVPSPYMLFAYPTTAKGERELAAAVHPYDHTARAQILTREANGGYYELIHEFEKLTGTGALLNTSFNLHGEPIVCSPEDALSVLERSGLEHLMIGDRLVSKPRAAER